MRPTGVQTQFSWPRPGKAILALLIINLVVYVVELILVRAGASAFVQSLMLTPASVFESYSVWQPATYMLLHSPTAPTHLLFNMLWLYFFATPLESWWGPKRLVTAYIVCGLSGAALTLIVALASRTPAMSGLLAGFWGRPHVGASGAVMGLVIAWGLVHGDKKMNFLLLGEMKAKTFVLIIIAFELLVALSLDSTSSTSHFGGMIGAYILCKGLWRPARWAQLANKAKLDRKKRSLERELRVIEGGKGKDDLPDDPKKWN